MINWTVKQFRYFKERGGKVPNETPQATPTEPVAPIVQPAIPIAASAVAIPKSNHVGSIFNKMVMGLGLMAIGSILTNSCQPQQLGKPAVSATAPTVKSHNAHIVKHRIRRHKKCVCHCNIKLDKPTETAKVVPSVRQIEGVITNGIS